MKEMKIFTKKEELILLAVCHLEQEACLLSIRQQIKIFTGKTYSVGTIYAPLNRLHVYGYLKVRKDLPESSSSSKRVQYYFLTDSGRTALRKLKRQTELMWQGIEIET